MTDATIADLDPISLPMDGTELLEIERAGTSLSVHSGDLGQAPPTGIAVTSAASPVDVDPLGVYFEITSGGSAGAEFVNLPNYDLDVNGFNGQMVGRKSIFYFAHQTDPADTVTIQCGGATVVSVYEGQRQSFFYTRTDANGIVLDTEGQAVCLLWDGYEWCYSVLAAGWNDSAQFDGHVSQYFGPVAAQGDGDGGDGTVRGAQASGAGNGGNAYVQGGEAANGNGGSVYLQPGASAGGGHDGYIMCQTLPTVDPAVDGALWNDGGTLRTSGVTTVNALEALILAASDEATAITAGTNKIRFRTPYAFTVTAVRASLSTAQASGSIFTVDVNEAGTSILSTKLTIDNTEKTSTTAATAAVVSDAALADDAEITVDVDQIGDGTAKGLKVILIGRRT